MRYFLRVLPYLLRYKPLAVTLAILIVIGSAAGLLMPWPLRILIDCVLGKVPLPPYLAHLLGPRPDKLLLTLVVVLSGWVISLLDSAVNVANSYVHTKLEQNIVLDFRSDMFTHAQKLSFSFYDNARSGMVIYQVNFQGDAAAGLLMAVVPLVQSGITLVGMFWISYKIDPVLALIALLVVPFLYYSVGYYATHIQKQLTEVKSLEGQSLSVVHESISMLRVTAAFCREPIQFLKFGTIGRTAVDARVRVTVRQTLFSFAVSMICATGTALVLGFGVLHVIHGKLTLGAMMVVTAYISAVYKPLEAISYMIGSLQDKFVNLKFAWDLMDTLPEIQDAPGAVALEHCRGRVQFEDVSFSYARRTDTLQNISFKAEPGQVVAVVGPTGAGKTTMVSLLPRFYAPGNGRVLIDGKDVSKLQLKSLREHISLVPQEPLLFSGTIADNIRFGRLDATDEEIVAAAQNANAHDFILRLPEQYQTQIGERGAQLSGGERQRICVARAFLKNAPILILDEPTSAIDSKTESVILDALERLMVGRTTFMIAHRLSTIHQSDWVLVMDQGRIVEQGTHEDVLAMNGLYTQLYKIQCGQGPRRHAFAGNGLSEPLSEPISINGTDGPEELTAAQEIIE